MMLTTPKCGGETIQIYLTPFLYFRRRKLEGSFQEGEDGVTQTSSPGGGWQGRLSAFLHVHRGSRASSRKSSRASDASDLSELGTTWLNLPLLLLSGTQPANDIENMSNKWVQIFPSDDLKDGDSNETNLWLTTGPGPLLVLEIVQKEFYFFWEK